MKGWNRSQHGVTNHRLLFSPSYVILWILYQILADIIRSSAVLSTVIYMICIWTIITKITEILIKHVRSEKPLNLQEIFIRISYYLLLCT